MNQEVETASAYLSTAKEVVPQHVFIYTYLHDQVVSYMQKVRTHARTHTKSVCMRTLKQCILFQCLFTQTTECMRMEVFPTFS